MLWCLHFPTTTSVLIFQIKFKEVLVVVAMVYFELVEGIGDFLWCCWRDWDLSEDLGWVYCEVILRPVLAAAEYCMRRLLHHSFLTSDLIGVLTIAKLVVFESGENVAACLASLSASSLPNTSLCPGTHWMLSAGCLACRILAALISLICQLWPGLSDGSAAL